MKVPTQAQFDAAVERYNHASACEDPALAHILSLAIENFDAMHMISALSTISNVSPTSLMSAYTLGVYIGVNIER